MIHAVKKFDCPSFILFFFLKNQAWESVFPQVLSPPSLRPFHLTNTVSDSVPQVFTKSLERLGKVNKLLALTFNFSKGSNLKSFRGSCIKIN